MSLKDKFTLEQRTVIIGFHPKETKNYGIIETPGFDDIKYRIRQNKPIESKNGILDVAFVVPWSGDIKVIEARLMFNKEGEFIGDRLLNISRQKYDELDKTTLIFGNFDYLESFSENLNFNYAKICYDKIMELYKELLK